MICKVDVVFFYSLQSAKTTALGESWVMAGCTPPGLTCEAIEGCLDVDDWVSSCVECCDSDLCNEGANEDRFYGSASALSSVLALILPVMMLILN